MIWIIASIPFWIIAIVFAVVGLVGIFGPLFKDAGSNEKKIIKGGFYMLILSGMFAVIAAKICS